MIVKHTKHDLELIRMMAKHQVRQLKNAQAHPGGQQLNTQAAHLQLIQDLESIIEKIERA